MEPKPGQSPEEQQEPLEIGLSFNHLNNLHAYVEQANSFSSNYRFLFRREEPESGFEQDIKYLVKKADSNKTNFAQIYRTLLVGGSIEVKNIEIPGSHDPVITAVGMMADNEFYHDFMAGLYGQNEDGIIDEQYKQVQAAVDDNRTVVLKYNNLASL